MDLILKTLVDSYFLCIVECFYLGLLFETLEHKKQFCNSFSILRKTSVPRGETRALIEGGEYSYLLVLPDEFLLRSAVIKVNFKRNSSGRTRIYEYSPPPPPQLTL